MTPLAAAIALTALIIAALSRERARLESEAEAMAAERRLRLEAVAEAARAAADQANRERWAAMTDDERFAENRRTFMAEAYFANSIIRPQTAVAVFTGIVS